MVLVMETLFQNNFPKTKLRVNGVFPEFAEFSEPKKIKRKNEKKWKGLLSLNPPSPVYETEMIPLYHKDTGNRPDP